jgi:hypothetical protein
MSAIANNSQIWSPGDPLLSIPPSPLTVANEIAPYPCQNENDAVPLVITPAGDPRSFKGMITRITVSRMPDADGNFPPGAPGFDFFIGARGILGDPSDAAHFVFTGMLLDGQNFRTWRNDSDPDFPGIPVLSPIPLIYRCEQIILVQALFVPEVPLSNYSEALPVSFQSAIDNIDITNERLKYIGIPLMAHHYNDTEALLNLI